MFEYFLPCLLLLLIINEFLLPLIFDDNGYRENLKKPLYPNIEGK